ncbi:hypothetical protein ACHAXR_006861 [Thalassiosira sp. AJA248-18]
MMLNDLTGLGLCDLYNEIKSGIVSWGNVDKIKIGLAQGAIYHEKNTAGEYFLSAPSVFRPKELKKGENVASS